jgi:hypothetical protein
VTQKDVKAKVVARDQVVTVVKGDGTTAEHAIKGLPPEFITWQMEARQALFQHLGSEPSIPTFAPHLPTLATWGEGALFPNLAAKGMGLLPRAELLEEYAAEFGNLLARLAGRPWPETIQERVAAAQRFYGRVEAVDRRCLGGLEIFEGTTYRNLLSNPFASLLYVGPGPSAASAVFSSTSGFIINSRTTPSATSSGWWRLATSHSRCGGSGELDMLSFPVHPAPSGRAPEP